MNKIFTVPPQVDREGNVIDANTLSDDDIKLQCEDTYVNSRKITLGEIKQQIVELNLDIQTIRDRRDALILERDLMITVISQAKLG